MRLPRACCSPRCWRSSPWPARPSTTPYCHWARLVPRRPLFLGPPRSCVNVGRGGGGQSCVPAGPSSALRSRQAERTGSCKRLRIFPGLWRKRKKPWAWHGINFAGAPGVVSEGRQGGGVLCSKRAPLRGPAQNSAFGLLLVEVGWIVRPRVPAQIKQRTHRFVFIHSCISCWWRRHWTGPRFEEALQGWRGS